ncbi:MAG: hypothetical protein MH472_06835 [Bacteroidia bacterium]|nr:hypothetical protein [Bacteroidia bacterium]
MLRKSTNKLNNDELSLISNTWYPLLKKSAMEKIKNQLHEIGERLIEKNGGKAFKISSGERLLDLPYMVLDYPKIERQDFNFVCRVLFWWGKGIQLQVIFRNLTKEQYSQILAKVSVEELILTGENLWENDLDSGAFIIKSEFSKDELNPIEYKDSLKIVRPIYFSEEQDLFFEGVFSFYERYSLLATQ